MEIYRDANLHSLKAMIKIKKKKKKRWKAEFAVINADGIRKTGHN